MTPEDIIGGRDPIDSCSADVAAYSLGALTFDEAESFRHHLESCAVCPVELVAFRQVVDDLAISVPQIEAPRDLRRRVMRTVEEEPALAAAPVRERRRARARLRIALPRPAFALSGGLAVAAIVALLVVVLAPGSSSERTVAAQVTGAGTASLQVSHDGHAQLVLHRFPAPQHHGIYEVWLQRGNATPSPTTALFSPNRDGDASVDVPGSLHGVTRVLVTPEPAGGTRVPTHQPSSPPSCKRRAADDPSRTGRRIYEADRVSNRSEPPMVGLDNPLHIAIVLVVVLMLFGAKRLPEMGKGLGEGMRGFKQAISGEHHDDEPKVSLTAAEQPVAPAQNTQARGASPPRRSRRRRASPPHLRQ